MTHREKRGGGDDIVIYTELWAWRNEAAQKLWTETTLSPLKFGQSLRWAETYAGFVGSSPLLEPLHSSLVKDELCINRQYEMYADLNARQFALWMTKPSMPWQTQEYYSSEAGTLSDNGFRRVHKNEFVADTQTFVPVEWWNPGCFTGVPVIDDNQPCILAADAAVSNDSFGLLLISGREDGENYDVRYARAWYPPEGGKIDFGAEDGPEKEIRRLIDVYNCSEFVFDPYQMEDMASRLRNEMLVHCFAFNQGKERLISDKSLHDIIRDKRLHHSGEGDLSVHIQNANAKSEGDDKMRIVKRNEKSKVDLAVCLSMALARAKYWRL